MARWRVTWWFGPVIAHTVVLVITHGGLAQLFSSRIDRYLVMPTSWSDGGLHGGLVLLGAHTVVLVITHGGLALMSLVAVCMAFSIAFGWLYLSWCPVHQALPLRCYLDYGTKASGLCELRSYCFRLSCVCAAVGLRGDSYIYESHHGSSAFDFGFCCL